MPIGRFLAGIGALIVDRSDPPRYLLLQRSPERDYAAGIWECATGRVDQGEGFEQALRREVREELGVEVNIEMLLATTHFYRGQPAPENELVGVVFLCTLVEPAQIRLSAEHTQARWVAAQEAQALLNPVEGGQSHPSLLWIRRLIERAEALRKIIPAQAGVVFGAGTDVT